jgi:hexosaminidase
VGLRKRNVVWLLIVVAGLVLALLSLVPFHLLSSTVLFVNEAPPVVPVLRDWHGSTGELALGVQTRIIVDPAFAAQLQVPARVFRQDLLSETGLSVPIVEGRVPGAGTIFFTLSTRDSGIGDEGYLLNIDQALTVNARAPAGVFYGTRTILQILHAAPDHLRLPRGFARDFPRYHERGFMLDVGRKFVPLPLLENYVRLMAWYKLNDFQLHFNDNAINAGNGPDWQHAYAAFRLNSPAFPGLAAADGSYTEQQIQELEQVAGEYAVTITPEIDTPAHSLALTHYRGDLASPTASKEFLNLANPASTTFVDALWQTFLPWFTAPQVNMGMDEYDPRDADRYRAYINHTDRLLRQAGRTTRMWGSLSQMPGQVRVDPDIVIENWDTTWSNPPDMVRQGFQIINASGPLLYIVPHASYYHDFLDTHLLYERWEPAVFDLNRPALNLAPGDPHLLGAAFAVWNDRLGQVVSDQDITARILPAMPVVGEKIWTGPTPEITYLQFEQDIGLAGPVPGVQFA